MLPAGRKSPRPKWHEWPTATGPVTCAGKPSPVRRTRRRRGPQSATREQAKAVEAPAPKADWSRHR